MLMFQREVAERIVATPAQRADYGRLAVLAQLALRDADPVRRAAGGLHAAAESHIVASSSSCRAPSRSPATRNCSRR